MSRQNVTYSHGAKVVPNRCHGTNPNLVPWSHPLEEWDRGTKGRLWYLNARGES